MTTSWRSHSMVVLPLIAIAAIGAAKGGFLPTSFGWTGLALSWTIVVATVFIAPRWGRLELLWLGGAAAVCGLTFLSATWAGSVEDAVNAGFRTLVYLAAIAGALVLLRRRDLARWLAGLVVGDACICVYALATRLLPAHFSGFNSGDYRLFEPLGYWNALGIFAAMGLLLGLGVAAHGGQTALRIASSAAAIALAPTLLFTFSRGAMFALVVGAAAMFALSPERLRLAVTTVVLGLLPAAAVLASSRAHALSVRGSSLPAAISAGHKLTLILVGLTLLQAALTAAYIFATQRIELPSLPPRLAWGTFALATVAAAAGLIARYGSPFTVVRHAYDSFAAAGPEDTDLNGRLLSLSNDGRTVIWHAAWRDFLAHPLFGSGAENFSRYWLQHRTSTNTIQDAHDLYLQTLAELGVVGLIVLAAMLAIPLIAAVRARREPLVAPAAGAYVAFLFHCTVDWDWQVPAVTVLALLAAATLIVAARSTDPRPEPIGQRPRIAIGVVAFVAAAAAFVGLVGNIALARSNTALLEGKWQKAETQADRARSWAPWSSTALVDLGQARVLSGSRASGLVALREAAAKDPGNWQAWFDLAAVGAANERQQALAHARALNPLSPEIASAFGN